jgi:hypothetical protein
MFCWFHLKLVLECDVRGRQKYRLLKQSRVPTLKGAGRRELLNNFAQKTNN